MDDLKVPEFNINTDVLDKFGVALDNLAKSMTKVSEFADGVIQALYNMPPELYHQMGLKHPDEIWRDYCRYTAEPDEVTDYIGDSRITRGTG